MEPTKSGADLKGISQFAFIYNIPYIVTKIPHRCVEKAKLAMELVEEARLFYINTQAQVSFNLLGPVIGALLILGFIWFLYNGMPSFLAEMGNAFSGLRNYIFFSFLNISQAPFLPCLDSLLYL